MVSMIHHQIVPIDPEKEEQAARCPHLLALCLALLLLFLGGASRLHAQEEPCSDSCCLTDVLLLNTGYDHTAGGIYPIGVQDRFWTVIRDDAGGPLPRPADVISGTDRGWAPPHHNTQWIANRPLGSPVGTVTYEKCFCTCGEGGMFTISLDVLAGGNVRIMVDGGEMWFLPDRDPSISSHISFVLPLSAGRHCIQVEVSRTPRYEPTGIDIHGTVEGRGLLRYGCCAPPDPCLTNHITLGTDDSWTLQIGPPEFGPYPRCADIITVNHTPPWIPAIPGSNWIGANSSGSSGPYRPGGELYRYRKGFCVERGGPFVMTITAAADDAGNIFLDGALLGPTGGFSASNSNTYVVALTEGCHYIDIDVRDVGFGLTGLTAVIDIEGNTLRAPECCACGSCAPAPVSNGGEGEHPDASSVGNSGADNVTMRPLLVSIPNPASGESVVQYVIDRDADVRMELFSMTGERVMVIDEGARTSGEHKVPIVTRGIPAGAYRLQLLYGTNKLSIPLNVR